MLFKLGVKIKHYLNVLCINLIKNIEIKIKTK